MEQIPLNDRPHVLYRMRNTEKDLLYVGISNDPKSRWEDHAEGKSWWLEVASVEIEHFANREDVERAEREAIDLEKPRYNIAHRKVATPAELHAILLELQTNERVYLEAIIRRKEVVKRVLALPVDQRPTVKRMTEVTGLSRQRLYQIRDLD